jgi:Transglycosylase SLT domain
MKGLRPAGAAALLLLMITPAAYAQDKRMNDRALRMIARSEAKHARSRQNLIKILRNQPNFWIELQATAKRLKTEPAWLLNVMASESLFDPAARSGLPGQTASGLLQFIESTAQSMGTTTEAIRRMSPVEQLRLVEKYLTPFRGSLNSLADVYLAVFRGFIIEGGDTSVVAPLGKSNKERRIYSLNRWLDFNGDGKITKGELALAAFTTGRFQPVAPSPDKILSRNARTAICAQDFSSPRSTTKNSARRGLTRPWLNNGERDGSSNSPYFASCVRLNSAPFPCRRAGEIAARPDDGDTEDRKLASAKARIKAGEWFNRSGSGHTRNAALGRLP